MLQKLALLLVFILYENLIKINNRNVNYVYPGIATVVSSGHIIHCWYGDSVSENSNEKIFLQTSYIYILDLNLTSSFEVLDFYENSSIILVCHLVFVLVLFDHYLRVLYSAEMSSRDNMSPSSTFSMDDDDISLKIENKDLTDSDGKL